MQSDLQDLSADTHLTHGASSAPQDDQPVFLRPDIKVEPLVHGWHAWPHLLAPLQHGLNIVNRHVVLMKSFLANPSIHAAAVANPAMAGGPFIDHPIAESAAIRELLAATLRDCAPLVDLANAYLQLDRRLQDSAAGYSLEEYYADLPEALAGLVELFYDINSHPRIRIFEKLLWDLQLAQHTQQVYVGPMEEDRRKFFMTNPRTSPGEGVIKSIPFADARLDHLAAARHAGAAYGDLRSILTPDSGEPAQPFKFVTLEPDPAIARGRRDRPDQLEVRYVGHACVLIESPETAVLIDPVLAWTPAADGRFTYYDLPPRIDYLAISHGHHDHFNVETLLQLRWRTGKIVLPASTSASVTDPSLKLMAQHLGYKDVVPLEMMEELPIPGGRIVSLPFPGEHADLDIYSKHTLLVEINGKRLLFLVDSNAMDLGLISRLAAKFGPIDVLFIGMECHGAPLTWLYGPLLSQPLTRKNDESRRLSSARADRAWEVVKRLGASRVYIYAMGQEPFVGHLMGLAYDADSVQLREARRLLERCRDGGVEASHLNGTQVLRI